MPSGSCLCGNVKLEYTSENITAGLCHCLDCRKVTGSVYSFCFVAKASELTITGTPKGRTKIADSGKVLKKFFCPDCGTQLYGGAVTKDGGIDTVVIRGGIFDDQDLLNRSPPAVEVFTSRRLKWILPIEGCQQFEEMLPSLY